MSQLLKKFALLTACAALALCFTARPAQAQQVEAGGAGEHLFFAYWSTANYTNTNVNIHSPLGVTVGAAQPKNVVYVRIRSAAADRNTVASFNICLMAGDSWTATLSMDGLMVMDPGECDGDLRDVGSNPGNMNVDTPMEGEMADILGETDSGYIEAWLNPRNSLMDDTNFTKAPDADFSPENAQPRAISGTAMLVSPMAGFSSSYNAVALNMCGNRAGTVASPTGNPTMISESLFGSITNIADNTATTETGDAVNPGDDGNGCWHVFQDDPGTPANEADAMGAPINAALMGQTKDVLTGRWTAIDDDNVMSHTKLVLTLPVNHFNFANGTSDPLSLHVFDDMGSIVLHSVGVNLPMGVNTCMFMSGMVSCNGDEVGSLGDAMSGEFRIHNNIAPERPARVGENPDSQTPAESLAVIGLVFSYFEGSDGMQYDQVTSLQWIDVDRDGNDPTTDTPPIQNPLGGADTTNTDTGHDL